MADFSTQVSSASSLRRPLPRTSSLVDTEDISGEKVSGGWSDVTKVTCFDLLSCASTISFDWDCHT